MGTFRAMNEEWRYRAHDLIRQHAAAVAIACGATIDVRIDIGYPFVRNDIELTASAKKLAEEFVGAEHVSETELRMGAEDFAFYSQLIPACFFRLGVGNLVKGISIGVHTPTFNIDEDAIPQGVGMMAWLGIMG